MQKENNFTQGRILWPLIKFMLPVFLALFLQSLYGAVDLLIVGQFGNATDVSAVSTGSQLMHSVTGLVCSFSMGITIILGQLIGRGEREEGGRVVGSGIVLFACIALGFTAIVPLFAPQLANLLNAPEEAFDKTCAYLRICGFGSVFIVAFNLLGSVFRGIGDSKTPLLTVAIASVVNVFGDLLLVSVFHMGAAGAAWATIAAQAVSVILSLLVIRKKGLPFTFHKNMLRWHRQHIADMIRIGLPIALQDFLVGVSFLVILALINRLGLIASAGVGVAQKVCGFIMLVPSAFSQALSAFVAQNVGANRLDRANKTLWYAIGLSAGVAVVMFVLAFFYGEMLCSIFAKDPEVIAAGAQYLKAYGVDCLLTCFLFCFIGYFNGIGMTRFVMLQGIAGAFGVRVPVSYFMSHLPEVSLFKVGLATPSSSLVQIILCFICFGLTMKKVRKNGGVLKL